MKSSQTLLRTLGVVGVVVVIAGTTMRQATTLSTAFWNWPTAAIIAGGTIALLICSFSLPATLGSLGRALGLGKFDAGQAAKIISSGGRFALSISLLLLAISATALLSEGLSFEVFGSILATSLLTLVYGTVAQLGAGAISTVLDVQSRKQTETAADPRTISISKAA